MLLRVPSRTPQLFSLVSFLTAFPLVACSSASVAPLAASDAGALRDASHDASHDGTVVHDGSPDGASDGSATAMLVFDLDADTTQPANFYANPFPSDLRLNSAGAPDYSGFPVPQGNTLLPSMVTLASARKGFSSLSVAYFQFTAPLKAIDPTVVIPAGKASTILLLDVDPTSPDQGTFYPTVAATAPADSYTAANVISVAAQPGYVLFPTRKYAFIIRKEQPDANGHPLVVNPTLATLAAGSTPAGSQGAAAAALYAPLFQTLTKVGIAADDVAAATVFTTGDQVASNAAISTAMVTKYAASSTISNLTVSPAQSDAGSTYPRLCELQGTISLPQFQTGTPPFATSGGTFQLDNDGLPVLQSMLSVPMAISIPTTGAMPAAGYPLVLYFHGSGGVSTQFIDRGPILVPDGGDVPGQGPAYVLAPFGFAMAGSALPANPQRVADAGETAYLQLTNLPALLGNFEQGIIEQRIFLSALSALTIDPTLVAAGCPSVSVPVGQMIHFDSAHLFSQGQSMGGMYANLITAVEPRFKGEVASGAGGFWTYFIFSTQFVPNANGLLELALGVENETLTFMHPALSMVESGWEAIDPIVSVPRVSRNPLPGTNPRPIYEPVGQNDSYFSNDVYNAVALAYGHREVGSVVWPSMQTVLTEEGLGGIAPYPTSNDVSSLDGGKYTGIVVQYDADTITQDGHYVIFQLDAPKYQYGCFFSSALQTGTAVVPAPATLGTPCPMVDGGQ